MSTRKTAAVRSSAVPQRPKPQVKAYPEHDEVDRPLLDPNNSLSKMLELVGERKRVLDVGCASGYFSRLLTMHQCDVVGIDANPAAVEAARAFCTQAFVADLDAVPLSELVEPHSFDVVVFGDVLEHLRNPLRVLEQARAVLKNDGIIVASIPNIAHGMIRLALLDGQFDYQEFGILDDTHLRFFTAKTVEELFVCAGYRVERVERTVLPMFESSNLVPNLERECFADELVADVRKDPECDTLQFVIRASPLSDQAASRSLVNRFLEANTALVSAERIARHLRAKLLALEDRVIAIESETEGRIGVAVADAKTAVREAARREELTREAAETRVTDAANRVAEAEGRVAETGTRIATLTADAETAVREAALREAQAREAAAGLAASAEARIAEAEVAVREAALREAQTRKAAEAAVREAARREAQTRETAEKRVAEITERLNRLLADAIDRVREETTELARQMHEIQSGRIWRLKNLLNRLFR